MITRTLCIVAVFAILAPVTAISDSTHAPPTDHLKIVAPPGPHELPDGAYTPISPEERVTRPPQRVAHGRHVSIQVNVAPGGANIVGDAANEPSIAVDPTNPAVIAIGWRQFDTILNNFRQAGLGYSTDRGQTWTFPGVLDPGVFRSDPVLDFAADGTFYYDSLTYDSEFRCDVFSSSDGGATWGSPAFAYGSDKQWLSVDRTDGPGSGHLYQNWSPFTPGTFNRSVDAGASFEPPIPAPEEPFWGVSTVAPDGAVYLAGQSSWSSGFAVLRSNDAQNPLVVPTFDQIVVVDLGGEIVGFGDPSPNPGGLLGQAWIAADHSTGPTRGNLYLLASVDPPGADPLDVHLSRSTDRGATWSAPVRVNDDPPGSNAWQWFGTMSVAPDGRIDVIWNDTRNAAGGFASELTYAYSTDAGVTWSANETLSPAFDPHQGWPQQSKLGDYYDMVSGATGVHIAYAATFNGEQDVYYLHLDPPGILFTDGFDSGDTTMWASATP